jgi:hypothetical protein
MFQKHMQRKYLLAAVTELGIWSVRISAETPAVPLNKFRDSVLNGS